MSNLHNPSGRMSLSANRRRDITVTQFIAAPVLRLRIAYYRRALSDMGVAHDDAGAVLLHISALLAKLGEVEGAR